MSQAKLPPHSDEAERSVLGALLLDRDAVIDVAELLRPEMFYKESNGLIFEAMMSLFEGRDPIDVLTVAEKLKTGKHLDSVGGRVYLSGLSNEVPSTAHIAEYANIVRKSYIKRQLIKAGAELSMMASDDGAIVEDLLDKAEQSVFSLSQKSIRRSFIPVKEALAESFDRLDELHNSKDGLRGTPTGITDLDSALAGMQDSNLIILAARPGVGKTALATNIAQYAAVERRMAVGYFALEMSNLEMVDRMLVAQAGIDAWKMKTGNLKDEDFAKISEAMGVLADSPLYIDDTPGQSILEMRTKARRLHMEVGLKLLVVDYLQLVVGNGRYESRVQEVAAISQGLKNLARELKIPVLALSQLNRQIESRGEKIPQLADLRESGSIEQDADVVMFLYRPNDDDLVNHKLSIAKHRNGPLRVIDLQFRGDRIKFHGVERARHSN